MLSLAARDKTFAAILTGFGRRRVNVINYETTCPDADNYMGGRGTNFKDETLSAPSCRSIPSSTGLTGGKKTRFVCDTVFARSVHRQETTGIQQQTTFNEPLFAVLYEINYSTPNEYKLPFNKAILTSSLEYRGRV